MGKIHDYANRHQSIPLGWALDEAGNPTTDAVAAKVGAIAPFGGAKGYALALAIEVLVSTLTGSAAGRNVMGTLDSKHICNKGDLFIVIDKGAAGGIEGVVSGYLDLIRASPPSKPAVPVLVPGDRARASRDELRRTGISVEPQLWVQLQELAMGKAS
jgi:LDH2 family malate/lactate/ureidoglycolate dehydrogenase